ncbi:TPA: acyltransferase [Serratia rubidaea]|uniref:acyltransferase family protein n=1 Tax=Serratia rubidaea TaxID=61652 RepID=UPI0023B08745|nr:acyltransferase [Serratia rubidaea]MDK1702713.1 acyltransferase [Serratia rubidaea]HDJ1440163.1 acyltransferase [Serratia rubidaea]HDJ1448560.1 acyltransferase [Serratia rubidaea]HDJ1461791.1 acyltransferase [Serratia rubidaea]HDJ2772371.1 acyltransferase [Serratia rubidaea]
MGHKQPSKERFIGLEWLRFLLGCYVMVYHTAHQYPQIRSIPMLAEFTSMGFFATSTFFILSGFLLSHVYFNGNQMREPARTFWAKRFFNLYPIHIAALLISILTLTLMQWWAIPPEGPGASLRFVVYDTHEDLGATNPEMFRHYMTNTQLAFNSLLQLLMLQAWNPYFLTFNAPLWSLSTLFFFYLLFPLLAPRLLAVRNKKLWFVLLWGLYLLPPIWVIWHQLYGMPYTGLLQRGPLFRLPEFLAGIVCYAIFRQRRADAVPHGAAWRWGCVAFIAVCFVTATFLFTHGGAKYWYFLLHNGLLLPAQCALVYLSALARTPASRWLQHWSPRLGAASLSIFALHVPLFNLFRTAEQWLRGDPLGCFSSWSACIAAAGEVKLSIAGYLLYLLLSVLLCLLFQERFVVPVRNALTRRFLPAKRQPAGDGAA